MKKDIELDIPQRESRNLSTAMALCEEMNPKSLVIGGITFDGEPFVLACCDTKIDEMAIVQYINVSQTAKHFEEMDLYE